MKSKRIVVALVAIMMAFALAPISNVQATADREYYQPKILINMAIDPDIVLSNETAIGKVIEEKFNVVFEYIPLTGDFNEKANLLLTTGDYPAIIGMTGVDNIRKYIDAGAAISLEPYIESSPNFQKVFAEQIPIWRGYSDKGVVSHWEAGVGGDVSENEGYIPGDLAVRSDALEACGWPKLDTASEFTAFLKEALTKLPTTNGMPTIGLTTTFAEPWGLQGIAAIGYEKGSTMTGAAGNNAIIWNHAENKFVDYFLTPECVESVKWFNELYREGVLDTECFTDLYQQTVDKTKSGRPIAIWYSSWASGEANTAFAEAGHPEMTYVNVPFQLDSQNAAGQKRASSVMRTNFSDIYCITKNAEKPERIFEVVEFACSEEGQVLLRSGVGGITYTVEDGVRKITEEYVQNWNNFTWKMPVGLAFEFRFLPSFNGRASDGIAYNLSTPELSERLRTQAQATANEKLGLAKWYDNIDFVWIDPAATSATIDSTSEVARIETRLIDFRVKAYARLITQPTSAQEFDALYETLKADYLKLSPEEVLNAYTEAYEANKSALN